ncbi:galactose ABC transporter substrate-binding protein [Clostridium beijerinckii]|nr:galactose ABC transporter substrate-binding protein [Clostridium beijerinckii]MZK52100.1 substrate-binding domain-containing protein [Clostridium beijerinckii]MZK61279.1 substrate-binding domain-containing protein [Clostridium beijerinckii]MZK71522.1 substrate-binding domain-containing protein [Clostridium beijerinckii]MZK85493.1 substrate-binding domain-containing protein [Clostridium beijerinckii]MZL01027.1 substrate-binding domain-containing protein [Clostridium beijerinckii]
MKIFKKILLIIMVFIIICTIFVSFDRKVLSINIQSNLRKPIKVGVVIHSFTPYMSLIRQNLEEIEKESDGNVKFTFWDSDNNEAKQSEIIDKLLLEENVDLILLNLVNLKEDVIKTIIDKIKQNEIPVILFFYLKPANMDAIKQYDKAFVVGLDFNEAGKLQGEILVDEWNLNKEAIDKNKDNILQYVMLTGPRSNEMSEKITQSSILAINNAGIQTEEIASPNANWKREIAKQAIESLYLRYNGKIEAIIASFDDMALGAVDALQQYGYNKGDKTKMIPVIGVSGLPEVKEYIKKGFMTGSVETDPRVLAKALYTVGMNLVYGREPLDGTDYKLNSENSIKFNFEKYP